MNTIKLLVLDFDGVMTDNRVLVLEDGREAVWCSRGDGFGIGLLTKAGLDVMVLSTEPNPVVAARCRKLNIPCVHDCPNKLEAMKQIAREKNLNPDQIAFVGNDLNDLGVMGWVGMPIAVADAEPEVLPIAKRVTTRPGGFGAVREVAKWILEGRRS